MEQPDWIDKEYIARRLEDARINDIRHRAITDMLNIGVPISRVKTAFGHSHTTTTDGYTSPAGGRHKGCIRKFDKRP